MGEVCVYLPAGSVGVELEAASRGAGGSTGCRVRGWTTARSSGLALRVRAGSRVLAVDDVCVEHEAFARIVALIKSSVRRKVSFGAPAEVRAPLASVANTAGTRGACHSCPVKARGHAEALSPVELLKRLAVAAPSDPPRAPCTPPRQSSHCALSPVVIASRLDFDAARVRAESAEEELGRAREEVLALKSQARGSRGELLLARFQLQRTRAEVGERGAAEEPGTREQQLRHWAGMRVVLGQLRGHGVEGLGLAAQLRVQRGLNARLEQQLHAWVDDRVAALRAQVTAEVTRGSQQPVPVLALTQEARLPPPSQPPCSRTPVDAAGQRALWLSARRAVFESPGPSLSPAAFRDHMARLHRENCTIKDDILKFRLTLKVCSAYAYSSALTLSA